MALVFDTTTNRWYVADANPDSSGLTVATLETEVNQIKAALRDAGILKPA